MPKKSRLREERGIAATERAGSDSGLLDELTDAELNILIYNRESRGATFDGQVGKDLFCSVAAAKSH